LRQGVLPKCEDSEDIFYFLQKGRAFLGKCVKNDLGQAGREILDMMGPRQKRRPQLFYTAFNLDQRIPADHVLRRIAATVDFDFVRGQVKWLYGRQGHRSLDPVVALKLMFLLFFENVPSERALLARLPMRLDWMWFCGYDLDDELPDHSVLSKARRRWSQEVFEEFFARILGQCIQAGLVDGTVIHVDSTMIEGNASKDKLQVYLRQVVGRKYEDLDEAAQKNEEPSPAAGSDPSGPQVASGASAGKGDEDSSGCKAVVGSSPVAEDERVPSESGAEPARLGQRITPVDPDARVGRKYGRTTLGYKDHRVVDDRRGIVTATVTTPANVNDEQMLATLMEAHESNTGAPVSMVAADTAYGTGENYRHLYETGRLSCIPHRDKNCNRDSDLDNRRFAYDETTDTFVCPAGQRLKRKQMRKENHAVIYEAPRKVCEGCRHFSRCVTSRTQGRRVSRNLNEPYTEWADGCLSRWERKRLLARRKSKIEGSFADAANQHGLKRARWRGLAKASVQNLLIAAAQNLRKLLRAVLEKHRTPTACGILKSAGASFSSVGLFARPDLERLVVRTDRRTKIPVRLRNTRGRPGKKE
jgi:transposase